jgi:hypothetical protein
MAFAAISARLISASALSNSTAASARWARARSAILRLSSMVATSS